MSFDTTSANLVSLNSTIDESNVTGGWSSSNGGGWGSTSSFDLCVDYGFQYIIMCVAITFTVITFGFAFQFYKHRDSPAFLVRQPYLTLFCVLLVFLSLVTGTMSSFILCKGTNDAEFSIQISLMSTFTAFYALWLVFLRSWRMLFAWKMSLLRLKLHNNNSNESLSVVTGFDRFWWQTYKYLGSSQSQPFWFVFFAIGLLPSYLFLSDTSNYYAHVALTLRYNIFVWMGASFLLMLFGKFVVKMNDIFSLTTEIILYVVCICAVIAIYVIVNDGYFDASIWDAFSFRDVILVRLSINIIRNSLISLLLVATPVLMYRFKLIMHTFCYFEVLFCHAFWFCFFFVWN